MNKRDRDRHFIVNELFKRAENQPKTLLGLENTIKYCAVIMMLVAEDL